MSLTDEQYKQVLKYLDGEMDAVQQKTFEVILLTNRQLNDEVEFYKKIRLLAESVEQKDIDMNSTADEQKKSNDEHTWAMISQAKKKWESQYEAELKLKYGIVTNAEKNIHPQTRDNRAKRIHEWKWLAAATVAGVICLVGGWLYFKSAKDNPQAVVINNEKDSTIINNKITDGRSTDSTSISESPGLPQKTFDKNLASKKSEKLKTLFKNNFIADAAPADKEGPLEDAFVYYENKEYERASRDFENADIGPLTRGDMEENRRLTTFYLQYYKALSYLASNSNTSKAITELKSAVQKSPDEIWKTKSKWYLALAHLKNGEIETCQILLKEVAGNHEAIELKQKAIALSKLLNENSF
jgi:hypothetical protein